METSSNMEKYLNANLLLLDCLELAVISDRSIIGNKILVQ